MNYFFDYIISYGSIGAILLMIVFFVSLILLVRKSKNDKSKGQYSVLYKKRAIFLSTSVCWLIIHYYLVIASIICTVNVIYVNQLDSSALKPTRIVLYSVLSILFTLGDLIIRPEKASHAYRDAYRLMDDSINKIDFEDPQISEQIRKCEERIKEGHS